MEKESKDFGAIKNFITGKTIREMTWEEIFSLATERLTSEEAMSCIKAARIAYHKSKSS